MLTRVEKLPGEVKTLLLNNKIVRQLLGNDSNAPLSIEAPPKEKINDYIITHPIYQFENKDNYQQHGMINTYVTSASPDDEELSIYGILRVNIVFNVDKWDLVDNKCRPMSIANEVIKLVNNHKFSISNKVEFASLDELIVSKQLVGYTLLFNITDGSGDLDNF